MRAAFLIIFNIFILAMTSASAAYASEIGQTTAKQALMIDYDTGAVLFEKNADMRMATSSMSKVMTMYVVFEALKTGRLALDTPLPVSEKAWRMGGSKMFVEIGKSVRVEDLIRGVIVQSGNDATIVLAEGLAGSEEAFAGLMNAKARELGMNDSNFRNASGWPDPDHYSTARDLARLGAALIREFGDYYKYYAEQDFTFNNIKQANRNPLLYRNMGADGIKTGHTEEGGYGLMASGVRGGRRVILVVNGLADMQERANESARLLEWGLGGYENVTLFASGANVENAEIVMGMAPHVAMVPQNDITVTIPVAVRNDLKVEIVYDSPLAAPVMKGQKLGILRVNVPRIGEQTYDLVAGEDVPALGFFAGLAAKAKIMVSGERR